MSQQFKSVFIDNSNKVLIDEANATTTYVGNAAVGSSESDSVWVIRRLTEVGGLFSVEFAEGDPNFTKVWDDRSSYSYS